MSKSGKGVVVEPAGADKASVERFERALDLLHREQWDAADRAFTQVVESDPGSTIAERARVFREVCRKKLDPSSEVGDDLYLTAVMAKNTGDLESAAEACSRGGLKGRDARFAYLAAAVESLRGNRDEAARLLAKAIELDPANRVHAFWDPDFADARKSQELAPLLAPTR